MHPIFSIRTSAFRGWMTAICFACSIGAFPALAEEKPIEVKPPLASLQADFKKLDAARLELKTNTKERADATLQASEAASAIGWRAFGDGAYDEATTWFSRSATLRKESFEQRRAYLEEYEKTEVADLEAKFGARIKEWTGQLVTEKDEKKKQDLIVGIDAMSKMQFVMRYNTVTQLQQAASDSNELSLLLKYNQQELEIRRLEMDYLVRSKASERELLLKRTEIARALERLAASQAKQAMFQDAEKNYQEALAIRTALPETLPERDLYQTLDDLGSMYLLNIGDYAKARDYYSRALAAFEKNAPQRAQVIEAEKSQDNKDLVRATQALNYGIMLSNMGSLMQEVGDYKAAGEYFQRAMKIAEDLPPGGYINIFELGRVLLQSRVLGDLASLHEATGQFELAKKETEQALKLKELLATDLRKDERSLWEAALAAYHQGDLQKSERYARQSQQLFAASQSSQEASVTRFLARLALETGRVDEASRYAREAHQGALKSGSFSEISAASRMLAETLLEQKKLDESAAALEEAKVSDARTGSVVDQISTLGLEGRVLEAQGKNDVALQKYQQAVTLLENIRANGGGDAFGETKSAAKAYERLVLLLLKSNRGEEAFDYLQRARSQQLKSALQISSLKTGDKALQTLLDKASTLETKLQTVRGQEQSERAKPTAVQDTTKLQNLQKLIASTQEEYRDVLEEIKERYPEKKIFTVDPSQIKKAQRSIPPDTALVQYAPLDDKFYILVVTRESLKIFTTPTTPDELWKLIKTTRQQISRPAANPLPTRGAALAPSANGGAPLPENLSALYQMLIAPIEDAVKDKSTLAFIPTQLLHYLPIHALTHRQDGAWRFLVEDKRVVFLSGGDVVDFVQAPNEEKFKTGLIAFGDPTGANLPEAREEVRTLAKIFPDSQSFTDEQATKTAVLGQGALDKRVVHFATHGILNATVPKMSYIQLSKITPDAAPESFQLTAREIWGLPLEKVDLVTLSACETALAEDSPLAGNDLTTLARAFSDAGAPTVVATLWSVADESTKVWMVEFYSQLAAGKPKGEAFHAAQLKLLNTKEYSHPYYWAPFILMGDWR